MEWDCATHGPPESFLGSVDFSISVFDDAVDVLALLSLPFFASVKYAGFLLEILSGAALPVVRGSHL